jgi:hypothetical protein
VSLIRYRNVLNNEFYIYTFNLSFLVHCRIYRCLTTGQQIPSLRSPKFRHLVPKIPNWYLSVICCNTILQCKRRPTAAPFHAGSDVRCFFPRFVYWHSVPLSEVNTLSILHLFLGLPWSLRPRSLYSGNCEIGVQGPHQQKAVLQNNAFAETPGRPNETFSYSI